MWLTARAHPQWRTPGPTGRSLPVKSATTERIEPLVPRRDVNSRRTRCTAGAHRKASGGAGFLRPSVQRRHSASGSPEWNARGRECGGLTPVRKGTAPPPPSMRSLQMGAGALPRQAPPQIKVRTRPLGFRKSRQSPPSGLACPAAHVHALPPTRCAASKTRTRHTHAIGSGRWLPQPAARPVSATCRCAVPSP